MTNYRARGFYFWPSQLYSWTMRSSLLRSQHIYSLFFLVGLLLANQSNAREGTCYRAELLTFGTGNGTSQLQARSHANPAFSSDLPTNLPHSKDSGTKLQNPSCLLSNSSVLLSSAAMVSGGERFLPQLTSQCLPLIVRTEPSSFFLVFCREAISPNAP